MRKSCSFFFALLALAVMSASRCQAEEQPAASAQSSGAFNFPTGEPVGTGASTVRMLGGLLLCLGIFGAGIHVYRRYAGTSPIGGKRRMRLIERLPVSQKSAVLLISIDGREMVVASGPDNLRLLSDENTRAPRFFEGDLDAVCGLEAGESCAQ